MTKIYVDPDIEQAETLPAVFYRSNSYFDELFLYLYWIVAKSFAVDNLLLTLSFKISLGGLKSPSEIGLKDIQKFAKSGIITIDKTKIIVGKIKE